MSAPDWLWIPITIFAALAQTLRNAAQRHLTASLGTLGATLVRFLYGLPFAALWLLAIKAVEGNPIPAPGLSFIAWIIFASFAQIAGTALLLQAMAERNFALGVAYAKTEVIQVAIFAFIVLGERVSLPVAVAIACGMAGVVLLSPVDRAHPIRSLVAGLGKRPALLGLAGGAGFGLSAVGYRAASLTFEGVSFVMSAATTLIGAQLVQTAMLGGWLLVRNRTIVINVLRAWRASLFAGALGAAGSAAWFTAFTIEPIAHVRALGLIEIFFTLIVSRQFFRERLRPLEVVGMGLLVASMAVVTLRG